MISGPGHRGGPFRPQPDRSAPPNRLAWLDRLAWLGQPDRPGQLAWLVRLALVPLALAPLLATLWGYTHADIWADDSAVYMHRPHYGWIAYAGRWLNHFLFPVLQAIGGRAALFANLLFVFAFAFIAARRYVGDSAYAFAFAALCIQAPPLVHQLTWPLITLPATAVLAAAALAAPRLPIYAFYALFGALLMGTMQFFYYLLPLLHLPLLAGAGSPRTGLRLLAARIVPAWAGGFLAGNLLMFAVVYLTAFLETGAGQAGLTIESWRAPRPVDGFEGLVRNTVQALGYVLSRWEQLLLSFRYLFDLPGALLPSAAGAVWLALVCALGERRHLPAKLLLAGVAAALFVAAIPLGIRVSFRSTIPFAFAAAALLVLAPQTSGRKFALQALLLLGLSAAWSLQSTNTLLYRNAVLDAYRDALLRTAPDGPERFRGILLMNDPLTTTVRKATRTIEKKLGLSRKNTTAVGIGEKWGGGYVTPWLGMARAAGFRDAIACGRKLSASSPICREARARFPRGPQRGRLLYHFPGTHDGYLAVFINPRRGGAKGGGRRKNDARGGKPGPAAATDRPRPRDRERLRTPGRGPGAGGPGAGTRAAP